MIIIMTCSLIDAPYGYGVMATISWNGTGAGTYDNYGYRLAMGGSSMLGWSTGPWSYGYSWAYMYYSTAYEMTMSTSGENSGGITSTLHLHLMRMLIRSLQTYQVSQ